MDFIKELEKLGACEEGIKWASMQPSAQEMWDNCNRGDWLLWLCGKLSGDVGSDSRKKIVYVACQCARLALPYITKGEYKPMLAIETAEKYCKGKATLEEVRKAAIGAYPAYTHAANVAYSAAVAYPAAVANAAASAVANAAASAADIVREHYPICPLLERSE